MTINKDIATAIVRLGKFAEQGDWPDRLVAYRATLLAPVLAATAMNLQQLYDSLDGAGLAGSLLGFTDEACLGAPLEPDGVSAIDAYLRRRGWQETARARTYLQAMRDVAPAVWEVVATEPGAWLDLRNRLGDESTVRVTERTASRQLQRYDRLVARVVSVGDENQLTGGGLMLMHEDADVLEGLLRGLRKGPRWNERVSELCLYVWTTGVLRQARRGLPELRTTDGEELLISRTRFTIASGVSDEMIGHRLDEATDRGWDSMSSQKEPTAGWAWFGPGATPGAEGTILATMRREGRGAYTVETLSRQRMERVLTEIETLLGPMLVRGLTSHEDVRLSATGRSGSSTRPAGGDSKALDASARSAEEAAIVREVTDAHYLRTLDEKVPMLGDRTPRQCSRSKAGRKKLVAWLKYLENTELRGAAARGEPPYDFGWVWRELGVFDER